MQPGRRPGSSAAWHTDMKKRASLSHPALKYTAFLFEPLGDDRNGVPLALASILGRMSLDPWSEAASLAAMPAAVAAQKLASLIQAMPNHSVPRQESNTLVERLIRLLPARSVPTATATAAIGRSYGYRAAPAVHVPRLDRPDRYPVGGCKFRLTLWRGSASAPCNSLSCVPISSVGSEEHLPLATSIQL